MIDILVFSKNQEQIHRWEKKLADYSINILLPLSESFTYKGVIAIIDETSYGKDIDKIINQLKKQRIRILLLEKSPTYEKAKKHITIGVSGYGNLALSSEQLNHAVKIIKDDLIWLSPEFSTELLQDKNQLDRDKEYKNVIILSDEVISIMKI